MWYLLEMQIVKGAKAPSLLLSMKGILKPLPIVGRNLPYGQILSRISENGMLKKLRIRTIDGIKWVTV